VAFKLTSFVPEAKKSKRGASPSPAPAERMRLSVLDGTDPDRIAWEDSEIGPLEAVMTEIAIELITTAEINYREACLRRHLWVLEKREALLGRLEEERRATELGAQNHAAAVAKARLNHLLTMAKDYRQARTIRLFVGAMRRRSHDADRGLVEKDFEDWCHWALAEADELDPAKSLAKFSIKAKHEKRR
jgi:hypothetical protein